MRERETVRRASATATGSGSGVADVGRWQGLGGCTKDLARGRHDKATLTPSSGGVVCFVYLCAANTLLAFLIATLKCNMRQVCVVVCVPVFELVCVPHYVCVRGLKSNKFAGCSDRTVHCAAPRCTCRRAQHEIMAHFYGLCNRVL